MSDWDSLKRELDLWQAEGRVATFWWRDDDVAKPTPQLDRLLHLREHFDLPLSLAVIPANLDAELVNILEHCAILQHGFAHENFSANGEKKSEFPESRAAEEVKKAFTQGKETLARIFTDQFIPIMVPPWNRIGRSTVQGLAGLGYSALSTFKPRRAAEAAPGLVQINTHLDPIAWKNSRALVPAQQLIVVRYNHAA